MRLVKGPLSIWLTYWMSLAYNPSKDKVRAKREPRGTKSSEVFLDLQSILEDSCHGKVTNDLRTVEKKKYQVEKEALGRE